MTTKVTVDPNAHAVKVVITDGKNSTADVLPAGSRPKDYIVHGDQVLTVSEAIQETK